MLPSVNEIVSIIQKSVQDWHTGNGFSQNTYSENSFEYMIYKKNQIDTIQWHVEDDIRRPDISDRELVGYKRRIDALNQERTDIVEILDDWFMNLYKTITVKPDARMNSETPAWLLDRMSILELKIYHMKEQTERTDVSTDHIKKCKQKLDILLSQREDMKKCFEELIGDISKGEKYMKVYRQMKMYNDKNLNPSLYEKK